MTAVRVSDAAPLLVILRRAVAYTESTDPDSGAPFVDAVIADTLIRDSSLGPRSARRDSPAQPVAKGRRGSLARNPGSQA